VITTEYEFHPLAEIFPLMEGGEFAVLIEDIRAHGLNEDIILFEDKILDGRNRDRACREARVEPRYRENNFNSHAEAADYVISANIHRRHLTAEQKHELIEKLLKADPAKSDRRVAQTVRASPTTVGAVRKRLEGRGVASKLDTRTDSRGRSQPASRRQGKSAGARKRKSRYDAGHHASTLSSVVEAMVIQIDEDQHSLDEVLGVLLGDQEFIDALAELARNKKVGAIIEKVACTLKLEEKAETSADKRKSHYAAAEAKTEGSGAQPSTSGRRRRRSVRERRK
jgi:hypothetical protein